ncbi:TetR/AcrR family transcriptional regulator [Rossellomorea yichunensis]|jgi:AcrR family transcriptional regulator|uniref:TetR/AcrR family transcriptional regulator n=1 Tax=Rossellomorea yichunensis TaxID=3077331 RepID=UPI0028E06ED6|nr:TetR/AcrR family transcriptional regulator [Rossellomorea sp. YC4-1]MDT9027212.1 TetR/AcrR family transcriptional regulator [Rossellomorea sp. YC4-1]
MSPRKAVAQELTKEMVMAAARELFRKKGYQQVSMRQIASELGYSHGSIYYHFKNKAELFYAMIETDFKLLDQWLDDVMDQDMDNEGKLRGILLAFIRFGLSHKSQYEMMFLLADEEVKSYVNKGPNESYEKFAQALIQLSDHEITIQQIWSIFLALHGFVSHYCRCDETYAEVENLAQSHVNFILKSIG